jgi:hypothetical protein
MPSAHTGGDDPAAVEFFEKEIRPLLADKCQKCHGAGKARGDLRLTERALVLKGGGRGPAAVAGNAAESLLIEAVEQRGELKMPPKGKLSATEIGSLKRWIDLGLPWPPSGSTAGSGAKDHGAALWWAFQPVGSAAAPHVLDRAAGITAIDRFIQAGLEARRITPAPPADKHTLLRRATLDLIGLPPTPDEVDAFLADRSPDAFAKVVNRLLASPRYGERWGRHWLDLVRYTDEFDEAWRYRDWVVNAFNGDLPYDQFIVNQIAGDLLPASEPGAVNAPGIIATTVLAIGPWGGIDRPKRLADIVDDQIDTISRSFLGLTIACARCHDHKFDPISSADYYGLAGFFFSSRIISDLGYLSHNPPRLKIPLASKSAIDEHRRLTESVREHEEKLHAAVLEGYAAFARALMPKVADYLVASWDYRNRGADEAAISPEEFATRRGLHGFALHQWIDYLDGPRAGDFHLMDQRVRDFDGERGVEVWKVAAERPWWAVNSTDQDVPIETFLLPPHSVSVNPGTEGGAVGWKSPISGTVSVNGRLTDADPHDGTGVAWVIDHVTRDGRRELSSGRVPNGGSKRLEEGDFGRRLSAIHVDPGDMIQLQVALGSGDAHYDITNVELTIRAQDKAIQWDLVHDAGNEFLAGNPHCDSLGHRAVWSFHDCAGSHRAGRMPAVDRLLAAWDATVASSGAQRAKIEAAARAIGQGIAAVGEASALADELTGLKSPFWVKERDDARYLSADARAMLEGLNRELEALRARNAPLPCALGIEEGGLRYGPYAGIQDARIYVRGNPTQPGRRVPRHFPRALAGEQTPARLSGSGRLELARWIAGADNPLSSRVMVDRLWQHHFGEGIVRTTSNFGRRGELPSHPKLLDWLARRFVESGWSIKEMHRRIMLSAAYQRSSEAEPALVESDPENRLWGRANRRKLAAEELHDGLLALSGRLSNHMGGPADSDASSTRRLIYLSSSRADRADFGSLFDRANPALHVERRTTSTVAPQALYLLNHPVVAEQAKSMARRCQAGSARDPAARVVLLYRLVYGRPATAAEIALGCDFIARDTAENPATGDPNGPSSWDRYAQALLLANEFLFVD